VAGRSEQRGRERVTAIQDFGGEATFLPVEADQRLSVQSLLDATITAFGQIDMLVNCAGATRPHRTSRLPTTIGGG
jgi:NAD(P)-dependent dehydrogenase (short-subunit alcohol dehydrogenase family)